MTPAQEIADSYWANVFEADRSELWSEGVHATFVDGGWDGVYVMRAGPSVRVRAPERVRPTLEALIWDVSPDALMSPSVWATRLAELRPTVLGPASHFLTDSPVDVATQARVLHPESVSSLAADVPPAELEEAGITEDGAALFGVAVDGQVVAVASLSEWADELSDIGVVTHPAFRGRGSRSRRGSDSDQRGGIACRLRAVAVTRHQHRLHPVGATAGSDLLRHQPRHPTGMRRTGRM